MAWTVEVTPAAARQIKRLGATGAHRVSQFLRTRIAGSDDPRQFGKALKGSDLGDLWRYRVGDYRILCELQNEVLTVLVVEVGHRREVYR
ncbi:MAG: type II toxin-antitoxin system RelE/ParE family toxin [Alphaproteobacteria bacterium]|nr:type II toxin-antitoxin system RelE/ParE family toxin [Alphaproteobacteria bacterium]